MTTNAAAAFLTVFNKTAVKAVLQSFHNRVLAYTLEEVLNFLTAASSKCAVLATFAAQVVTEVVLATGLAAG